MSGPNNRMACRWQILSWRGVGRLLPFDVGEGEWGGFVYKMTEEELEEGGGAIEEREIERGGERMRDRERKRE